jgi:GrpB-like predicted nucleotidyltransferase (UPF0157 family)
MRNIIGLKKGIVRLEPHNEEWTLLFEEERARIETAVGPYILDIQHVGSTAIPGIPAKPIIDINVAVRNFEEAAVCIDPLVQLGYVYRGENGIPRRHYFHKGSPGSPGSPDSPHTHHLHMDEISGPAWQNQILFRDYLRQHPETAAQYARLKTELAQRYPTDRNVYLDGKAPFIEKVLRLARQAGS